MAALSPHPVLSQCQSPGGGPDPECSLTGVAQGRGRGSRLQEGLRWAPASDYTHHPHEDGPAPALHPRPSFWRMHHPFSPQGRMLTEISKERMPD